MNRIDEIRERDKRWSNLAFGTMDFASNDRHYLIELLDKRDADIKSYRQQLTNLVQHRK